MSAEQPRGIYSISTGGEITTLAKDLGRLDGLYQMDDGTLLITDWTSGVAPSLEREGHRDAGEGFQGPRGLLRRPEANGLPVAVPDLVQSELRLVRLAR